MKEDTDKKEAAMNRTLFIILLILGIPLFYTLIAMEAKYPGGKIAIYYTIVYITRRWYLSWRYQLPWWHWLDITNVFDQFKKP
jgi:hypothetical protein